MIGQTISHYRIIEKLGEGGMGVVYKAEDTQLRRAVALKFLAQQGLNDPETKSRLIREAQASASLDHPNICAVHGIHEENGRTFIAMAFIDGPSLADKIKERPLPLQEALDIALQIAAGLQEAHEKGVVHRDIKPQNIMLTGKGQVKIMDFGLASLVGRSKLTKSGTTLGTPAYMAPEQLQARQVDQRADIWALGCVLYEMLAQRSPFAAEYEQAIGYGILNEDPEPVSAQRADVKPEVDQLIAKTLAKAPDERYQDADDLLADLRGLSRREKIAAGVPRTRGPTSKVRLGRILAAVFVVALLLILAFRQLTPPRLDTGVVRLSLVLPEGTNLTSRNVAGPTPQIALSPDGHVLAYVASMAGGPPLLWIRALDSMDARELSGTEGASFPFWSPDSQFLGFFAAGKLKMVDAFGGTPRVIADAPHGRGGAWNNVGIIVYADGISTRLKWVRAQGGVPGDATSLDENKGEMSHRFPRFLPDGRHFMYVSLASNPHNGGVYVTSLDSGAKKQLLSRGWSTPYVVDDYLLSAYQGKLMAQQFDSRQLKVSGSPAVVAEHVGAGSPSGLAALSVSEAGTLAYSSGTSPNRHLIWFDRLGNRLSQIGDVGEYLDPSLSPDERTLAVARVNPDTRTPDIWLFDILRRTETRLTIDPGSDIRPQWSPDGSRLVFTSNRTGTWEIHEKVVTNAEPEKRLTDSAQNKFLTQWSPDSRSLIFSTTFAGTSWDLWFLRVGDGEDRRRPLLQGPFNEVQGIVSQDGLWMAYTSDETGRLEVYVQSFPSGGSKSLISANGGWDPKWSAKGTELFFLSLDGKLMTVSVNPLSDFTPALPKELFEVSVPPPESPFSGNYAVTSDGKRFLINTVIPEATSSPITIVLNGLRKFAER